MSQRSELSPQTLGVEIASDEIAVEYLDGRRARYRGTPSQVEGRIRCQPGKEVHVLVADEGSGMLLYVNDRRTNDEILEATGVGRLLLEPGEGAEPLPGVHVRLDGYTVEVTVAPEVVGGRVFVFEEDEFGERSHEIVEE